MAVVAALFPLGGGELPGEWLWESSREEKAMAKIVSRKDKRKEVEAAEAADAKPAKKVPAKRKSRAKAAKDVRLKAFWGVFNQSMKRVALFDYSEQGGRQEGSRTDSLG